VRCNRVDVPLTSDRFISQPARRIRDDTKEQVARLQILFILVAPDVHRNGIDRTWPQAMWIHQAWAYGIQRAKLRLRSAHSRPIPKLHRGSIDAEIEIWFRTLHLMLRLS